MKKPLFFLLYFLIPVFPAFFYLSSVGSGLDSYSISVVLGILAFVLICGQFILASRPTFAVQALGLKGLLAFHGTMPPIILGTAAAHKLLKEFNGFPDDTLQATLGGIAWWALLAVLVLAVLLMANTFWLKLGLLKKLKAWIYEKFKLTYNFTRIMHNSTIVVAILLLIHVFLASSSDFNSNPAGIIFMGLWLIFSLVLYGRYKIQGMASKGRK